MLQTLSCLWYLMVREDPFSEEKLVAERRENLSKVTEEGLGVGATEPDSEWWLHTTLQMYLMPQNCTLSKGSPVVISDCVCFPTIDLLLLWVFIAACGLSLVAVNGGYSSLQRTAFSFGWLPLFQNTGSGCIGFSSFRARTP